MGSRLDEERLHTHLVEPPPDRVGRELRAVIRTNVGRRPSLHEKIAQTLENVLGTERSRHLDRQAFSCELIHDHQVVVTATALPFASTTEK